MLVFGEPGLGKGNVGALIHFGSGSRGAPMVRACDRQVKSESQLVALLLLVALLAARDVFDWPSQAM